MQHHTSHPSAQLPRWPLPRIIRASLAIGLLFVARGVLASTIMVNSTADTVADDGVCTLREAITAANSNAASGATGGECAGGEASPTVDTITFDIPGAGVHTITPVGGSAGGSDLPFITEAVTIDGYTQPGSQPNTNATGAINAVPLIEVDGSGSGHCFFVFNSGTNTIRGLVINGCHAEAIGLESGSTTFIEGNFIGTNATGTAAQGLDAGISMFVQGGGLTFTVGGTTPAVRNLLSGITNTAISVFTNLNSSIAATVQGNLIGTDKTGMLAVPNTNGIGAGGQGSDTMVLTIGGSATGAGNVISGNRGSAIQLNGFTANSVIQGNLIGTAVDGTSPLGNGGVAIHTGDAPVTIGGTSTGEGNVIAYNGSDAFFHPAVFVETTKSGTLIAGNSIFANVGLGIDLDPLGLTPNDDGDPDTGANGRQNFPVLAGIFPGGTSVGGTLNSTLNTTFRIEVFANDACDPSGNGGGQSFVRANDAVTTDGSGHADFTVTFAQSLPAGTILTATATAPDNSTSEFGPCTAAPPTTTSTTTTTSTSSTAASSTSTSSPTTTTSTSSPTTSTSTSSPTTSTSTSSPATSTSTLSPTTSTSTSIQPPTSTTQPGDVCASVPVGPTFISLDCRLAALIAQVSAESGLGALQPKLLDQLQKAKTHKEQAEMLCRQASKRRTRKELRPAINKVVQFLRTLKSRKAQTIPQAVKDALRAAADGIRLDMEALQRAVQCPQDAPPA